MINLPFDLGYMTPEIKEKAERELGETEEIKRETIIEFRKHIREEPKLFCPDDDEYLLQFLRARKFNVKRAWSLLLNYYHIKKHHPEVYHHDFFGLRNMFLNEGLCVLPYRDAEGCPIGILKLANCDLKTRSFASIVHDLTIFLMLSVEDVATQVCGIKFIVDLSTLSVSHIKYVHPKYLHLIAKGMKNCLPGRFKGVHIVNESFIFQYFWNILKVVMTEKLKTRMHFHSTNRESLYKHFSPDILPIEYGGNLKYDPDHIVKILDSLRLVYDAKMSYGFKSRKSSKEGVIER